MNDFEVIKNKLEKIGVAFEVVIFNDVAISARDTDSSVGHNYNPANAIKTILVKAKGKYYGIILRGGDKIDDKKLDRVIGKWSVVSGLTLAETFGFVPGTVCPLVLEVPIYADIKVLDLNQWSMGAGSPDRGINVKLDEVTKKFKFNTVDISI
jgi:prolyl-tRNA editing enzyme YbaK/EbsC (Cys-tRNA(Pro) deacylase)